MIKTIAQIRLLQRLCQASIAIATICVAIFLGAILNIYHLKSELGHLVEDALLASSVIAVVLVLVLRYVRFSRPGKARREPDWQQHSFYHCH